MATSGSTNFNQTRDDLVLAAFKYAKILGTEESLVASDLSFGTDILNRLIKTWQGQDIHLWKYSEAGIYFVDGTNKYNLPGASGGDNPTETALSAAASSSATSLSVTSTSGMATSDVILIELDDTTLHSTTISTIPSSTTLTIASGLASAAASGNNVYTYTTAIGRPLRISQVRLRNDSNIDRELSELSRTEYFALSNKSSEGEPVMWYYDPQLTTGKLYVWPTPENVSSRLSVTYSKSIEDFDSATDNPDFPQEWLHPIVLNLAAQLMIAYGKNPESITLMKALADEALNNILDYDNERGSVYISSRYPE